MLFNFLSEGKKNKGFYWKFYAPFFSDLKEKGYTDILSNIILIGTGASAEQWLTDNQNKTNEFYDWVKNYKWSASK